MRWRNTAGADSGRLVGIIRTRTSPLRRSSGNALLSKLVAKLAEPEFV